MVAHSVVSLFFFFNDTATTEIYTLSLHDALPISRAVPFCIVVFRRTIAHRLAPISRRSEEHTSELQSLAYLVCRLLLEKKKKQPPHLLLDDVSSGLDPKQNRHLSVDLTPLPGQHA